MKTSPAVFITRGGRLVEGDVSRRATRAWCLPAGFVALALTGSPQLATAQIAISAITPGERLQDVEISAAALYDSDVLASQVVGGIRRGVRASDFIFEPAIRFDIARPIGRETVFLQGSAGYDFYARNSILNRENIDISPGVIAQVGRCQTSVVGNYRRAQSDLSELALTPSGAPLIVDEKNIFQAEQVSGSADCGKSFGLAPNVTASETVTQNSSPTQRYTDAQTFSGSAGLAYRRPTFGSVSLFGAYSKTDFPNRAALGLTLGIPISTGYQTYSGGVTYSRAVGARLRGSASLSYTKLEDSGGLAAGFSGLTYSVAATYQISSRLVAQALISRATVPSTRLNSTFGLDNVYSSQLTYTMSSRVVLTGGGSLTHNTYNGVPYPVGFDLTDEKYYRVFGSANYQLTRRLSFGVNAEHLQRDANFPGLTYPETRVGLTARARF